MRNNVKRAITFITAGAMLLSVALPARNVQAEELSVTSETAGVTQFMDCFEPMPIVESLSTDCWGAPEVGARDQGNGLEDRKMAAYSYWDGGIVKDDETGKYYMFASRWNQAGGHWGQDGIPGWQGSQAVYAVSDNLYGPYEDKGPIWPDWCEGAGHNVFPFALSEDDPLYGNGYRYAISISDTGMHGETANGTIHIAKSVAGPWELVSNNNGGKLKASGGTGFSLSNISIMVRPDGRYEATNRNGDIAIADSLAGTWDVKVNGLWWQVPGMSTENIEDPVIWYSDGLYHIVVNKWDARMAYYLTSKDGITNWKRHPGTAYTPDAKFLRYTDGTENNWTKIERPNIYVEDGKIKAMTFAVIDVQKESDFANDQHGSKVIVVPFSSEKLTAFSQQPNPLENRGGIQPVEDTNSQSWEDEIGKNYGAEHYIQLQKDPNHLSYGNGYLGEGSRPVNNYDNKIGYLKYDISEYQLTAETDVEKAYLSLVYISQPAGNAEKGQVQAVLAGSDWTEGIGRESVNGNWADPGTLTWQNQPALYYDTDDMENTMASSEAFRFADLGKEVKLDVTDLVRQFIKKNPGETVMSFALNISATGNRIRIGSREAGESNAPKLLIQVDKSEIRKLLEEADKYASTLYTKDSWNTFAQALEAAKQVELDENAAAKQIRDAAAALQAAISGLVREYAVTLNLNYDNKVSGKLKYAAGTPLGSLQSPARTGYHFLGWYTSPTGGQQATAGVKVQSDLTLYARWEKIPERPDPSPKAGFTFAAGDIRYKVTKAASGGKAGSVQAVKSLKNKRTSVKIPDTVKYQNNTFKVTDIGKNAFKNHKKMKTAVIGNNVKMIQSNAFAGCKALKKVTVGKNVEKIGSKAFYKDSALKKITIKSKKLKSVGANALRGIHKKAKISVPSAKQRNYKNKVLKNRGQAKTVIITR